MVIMMVLTSYIPTNKLYSILLVLHFCLPLFTEATTEWFGDLRAHLNPPNSSPFYDVTYDDSDCPMGLQSNAIPEFVYFGEMVATKSVEEHSTCLQICLQNTRCKAVNFFEPLTNKEKGFCELLGESQYDNPRLMRPFKKAIYYENIRCRAFEDEQEYMLGYGTSSATSTQTSRVIKQKQLDSDLSSSKAADRSIPPSDTTQGYQDSTSSTKYGNVEQFTPRPKYLKKLEALSILKKLAAKVHELNLRFRSR